MSLIKAKGLALGYEGKAIIENISFEVEKGDFLCIVGENGSGKTTLMKTVLGLKKPFGGELIIDAELRKKQIGYLPQQTAAQKDFPASVYEVVLSGCLGRRGLFPFFKAEDKALASENMAKLGISDLRDRSYRELSGGQQQRVLLARALCASSEMLLLDEPVSGLDPSVTAELYSLIRELHASGLTVIMISHDIKLCPTLATHVLHLSHTPLFFGKSEDYLKTEIYARFSAISNQNQTINSKE